MAESDEEVDYMSAEFLEQCVGKQDVRPGLMFSHASKRKAELDKKKTIRNTEHSKRFKPIKEVQKERLEEGLSTAITSSNKGFSMLQKMGYKPGMSLGKDNDGRLEPVKVEVKTDRIGLGWQEMIVEHRRKKEERRMKRKNKHAKETDPEKYRARMRSERQAKYLHQDLMKSQRVCYELDSKDNHTEPVESWFWPHYTQKTDEEEEDEEEEEEEEEMEIEEQLNILTAYLRTTYIYCIWCGTVFNDENDLKQNCPGTTRQDHDD